MDSDSAKDQSEPTVPAQDVGPGTLSCHEALHMASFLCAAVDEQLASHPSVEANPEWLAKAEAARESLFELYQAIGKEHLVDSFSEEVEQ